MSDIATSDMPDDELSINEIINGKEAPTRTAGPFDIQGRPVTFVFRALGRQDYEALGRIAEYQPTDTQRAEYRRQLMGQGVPARDLPILTHNPETYPPALIAACCISPVMTVEDATSLWNSEKWTQEDCAELFLAAQLVNQAARASGAARAGNG